MTIQGNWDRRIDRRDFLRIGGMSAAVVAFGGGLSAFGARAAMGQSPERSEGYGPLVPMGDIALPEGFTYTVISRQGDPMSDGNPTPGIFDGMGAFRGPRGSTVLIRNHENRRSPGEIPVVVPQDKRYDQDPSYNAGNTKLVVDRNLNVVESFAVLGGTDTNCAGGMIGESWITCKEVFNQGATGTRHGYIFEIDSRTDGPVEPRPVIAAGRFVHEAVAFLNGILYETEDRRDDSFFYRYIPDRRSGRNGRALADTEGELQALKIRGVNNAVMDTFPEVGRPYKVEWVTIDEPNPATDTVGDQARAKGAAIFDREEGIWVGNGKVYFDCTEGGEADLGQVFEYDPKRKTLTLIFESTDATQLENPDNIVIVPKTGDIFLQEDGDGEQFVRGLTPQGEIYDFAMTITNDTEFCGGCFSPDGNTFFLNQQGERGPDEPLPGGTPTPQAVTYAIQGPFGRRRGRRGRGGNGRGGNGRGGNR